MYVPLLIYNYVDLRIRNRKIKFSPQHIPSARSTSPSPCHHYRVQYPRGQTRR